MQKRANPNPDMRLGGLTIALVLSAVTILGPPVEARAQSHDEQERSSQAERMISAIASNPVSGWAQTGGQSRREIFEIDRKVMLECIKLARFSINFHLATNRTGFWRSWIYPLEQESGTALSFSNTLTDLTQRARGLESLDLISRPALKRGLTCATTGQSISGTSSVIELAHNGYIALQARQQGFSPGTSEDFVRQSLNTIDTLLDQREALLKSNATMEDWQVVDLQGKLLRHIRNQLLYAFKQFSIRSRSTEWRENTFYSIDAAQAFAQLASSMLSFKGFTNRRLAGPAAITILVANSLVAVNPFIRSATGRYAARYQSRRLSKMFPEKKPRTMEEFARDLDELNQIISGKSATSKDTAAVKEVSFLVENSQAADRGIAREQEKMETFRRVADQQAIAGPIIGLFSVARSTSATVAFYGYRSDPVVANQINFAGRISQATGQTYSLLATPTAKIRSYLYTRSLAESGQLPSQIFQRRLLNLDHLEAAIKSAQP